MKRLILTALAISLLTSAGLAGSQTGRIAVYESLARSGPRGTTQWALSQLESEGPEAIPALMRLCLDNEETVGDRLAAFHLTAFLDPYGLPHFMDALDARPVQTRKLALECIEAATIKSPKLPPNAICCWGPTPNFDKDLPKPLVADLFQRLDDALQRETDKAMMVGILEFLQHRPTPNPAPFIQLLDHRDLAVAAAAADGLVKLASSNQTGIAAAGLRRLARDNRELSTKFLAGLYKRYPETAEGALDDLLVELGDLLMPSFKAGLTSNDANMRAASAEFGARCWSGDQAFLNKVKALSRQAKITAEHRIAYLRARLGCSEESLTEIVIEATELLTSGQIAKQRRGLQMLTSLTQFKDLSYAYGLDEAFAKLVLWVATHDVPAIEAALRAFVKWCPWDHREAAYGTVLSKEDKDQDLFEALLEAQRRRYSGDSLSDDWTETLMGGLRHPNRQLRQRARLALANLEEPTCEVVCAVLRGFQEKQPGNTKLVLRALLINGRAELRSQCLQNAPATLRERLKTLISEL